MKQTPFVTFHSHRSTTKITHTHTHAYNMRQYFQVLFQLHSLTTTLALREKKAKKKKKNEKKIKKTEQQ